MLGGAPAGSGGSTGTFNGGGWMAGNGAGGGVSAAGAAALGAAVGDGLDFAGGGGLAGAAGVSGTGGVGFAEGVWAVKRPAKQRKEARKRRMKSRLENENETLSHLSINYKRLCEGQRIFASGSALFTPSSNGILSVWASRPVASMSLASSACSSFTLVASSGLLMRFLVSPGSFFKS